MHCATTAKTRGTKKAKQVLDNQSYRTMGYQEISGAECSRKQQLRKHPVPLPSGPTGTTPALLQKSLRTQILHSLTGAPRKTREWSSGRYLPGSFWREDEFLWEPAVERQLRDGRRQQLPPPVLGGRRLRHDGSHLKCGFRGARRAQQLVQDRGGHLRCGTVRVQ